MYLSLRPVLSQTLPLNPERQRAMIADMTGEKSFLDAEDGSSLLLRKDGSFQVMDWPRDMPTFCNAS
jgi:hypothetical protein